MNYDRKELMDKMLIEMQSTGDVKAGNKQNEVKEINVLKDGLEENKEAIQEKLEKIVDNVEENDLEKNYIIPEKK
jgi:hypothetical protein